MTTTPLGAPSATRKRTPQAARLAAAAGLETGYRTRWVRPPEQAEDPERVAIREALAFGKAVHDQRCALGLSVTDLAGRAGMSAERAPAAGHDLGSVWFEAHAA